MRNEELYRRVMELERRLDDLAAPESIATFGGELDLNQLWNLQQIYSSNDAGQKPTWYTCRSRLPIYTIVQDGDDLNLFEISGWDGVKFKTAARIGTKVDGAPALDSVPGEIILSTTAVGDAGPTDRMTIDSDGYVHINVSIIDSIALGCRAYRSATQSISDNTLTALSWNTQVHDTDTCFAPTDTKLYARHAGYYMAGASIMLDAGSVTGERIRLDIRKGGSKYLGTNGSRISNTEVCDLGVATGMFYMAVDEYVEAIVFQTSGGARTIKAADVNNQHKNSGWLARIA